MTTPHPEPESRTLRRPPAPPTQWATVTRLGPGPDRTPAPVPVAPVNGSLALQPAAPEITPDTATDTAPPQTPALRVVDEAGAADDVHAWAARFAQGVVEVLGGDRPLPQLVRWTTRPVYQDLDRRLSILARTSVAERRLRTIRPQVRSVHVCHPTPEAAEVSVHVRHGRRSRAIAARLELQQGHWRCTALQLG